MNCPLLSFWIISKFLPKQSPTRFAGAPFAQGGLFQMRYAECPGVRTLGAFLCLRDARCPWSSQSPRHLGSYTFVLHGTPTLYKRSYTFMPQPISSSMISASTLVLPLLRTVLK